MSYRITFNKDERFSFYGGFKNLEHGHQAKIGVSISPNMEKLENEMKELLETKNLETLLEERKQKEEEVYSKICDMMQKWVDCAKLTSICQKAIEYEKEVEKRERYEVHRHTGNKWVQNKDRSGAESEEISNAVYSMSFNMYESTKYNHQTRQLETEAFYITWGVYIGDKHPQTKKIAGQSRKRYTNKNQALKYIEGRKKAYSHLFTEINPCIPQEHKSLFMVNGLLLPNYKIEKEGVK